MSAVFPVDADERFRVWTASAGQTAFAVPFPWQDDDDIAVVKIDIDGTETTLANPADYTLFVGQNVEIVERADAHYAAVHLVNALHALDGWKPILAGRGDIERLRQFFRRLADTLDVLDGLRRSAGGSDRRPRPLSDLRRACRCVPDAAGRSLWPGHRLGDTNRRRPGCACRRLFYRHRRDVDRGSPIFNSASHGAFAKQKKAAVPGTSEKRGEKNFRPKIIPRFFNRLQFSRDEIRPISSPSPKPPA